MGSPAAECCGEVGPMGQYIGVWVIYMAPDAELDRWDKEDTEGPAIGTGKNL